MNGSQMEKIEASGWSLLIHTLCNEFALNRIQLLLVADIETIAQYLEVWRITIGFVAHSAAETPARWSARLRI